MVKNLGYIKVGLVSLTVLMLLLYLFDKISLELLLNYSMFLVVLLVIATLGGALFNFIENPKNGVRFFIGLVAVLIFVAISYAMSTDTIDKATNEVVTGSRLAEAGILTCYFLFVVAGVAIAYSSIKRIFG